MEILYPGIIADPGTGTGFSPGGNMLYDGRAVRGSVIINIRQKVNTAEHWLNHYGMMKERKRQIDRQTLIDHVLVFTGDGYGNM